MSVYDMQTIPLEEYRKQIKLQGAREEAAEAAMMEVARLMLADGKPLQEVAKYTRLPVGELQQLHATTRNKHAGGMPPDSAQPSASGC